MDRRQILAFALCVSCLWATAAAEPKQAEFSDEAVERAIAKGVEYLWSAQGEKGNWPAYGRYEAGPTALAVYALLETGVSPQDPRMAKALEWLKETKTTWTYTLSLRCNAWLIANRKTQIDQDRKLRRGKYFEEFVRDVSTLIRSTSRGSYDYVSDGRGRSGDNSNSQYGLLGVWAGAMGGLEIPQDYWRKVMKHWLDTQTKDGGWTYRGGRQGKGTATMTAAGVASLFVCMDSLFQEYFVKCNQPTDVLVPVQRGLRWFERNFAATVRGQPNYYYLYGVERVALASGYKYFGTADWYELGGKALLAAQRPDGSWTGGHGGPVPSTSFALLFLVRGRHPVLFNKLEFDGDWNNRPRDLATLTRWMGEVFERTINWQIINLRVPVRQWQDAPILYISGSRAPRFTDADVEKLRRFVWQGGTIFSATEGNGQGFSIGIRQLYGKLFPQYKLTAVPRDHDLHQIHFELPGPPRLQFHMVSNGIRPLVIHTDMDLPMSWQRGRAVTERWAFEAAANVYMYVTDKGSLVSRGTRLWPPQKQFTPKRVVRLARLKHNGNYDPEPLAYERLVRLIGRETNTKLEILGPMPIAELPAANATVATLTGVEDVQISDADKQTLKKYVAGGGTLVIDAAGGSEDFDRAATRLVTDMYGWGYLQSLPASAPIYREPLKGVQGLEISKVRYRRKTMLKLGRREPNLRAVLVDGRPAVLYGREDLTAGLVGYPSYVIDGYHPGDDRDLGSAYQIMRNIILYAYGQQAAATAKVAPDNAPATKAASK